MARGADYASAVGSRLGVYFGIEIVEDPVDTRGVLAAPAPRVVRVHPEHHRPELSPDVRPGTDFDGVQAPNGWVGLGSSHSSPHHADTSSLFL